MLFLLAPVKYKVICYFRHDTACGHCPFELVRVTDLKENYFIYKVTIRIRNFTVMITR